MADHAHHHHHHSSAETTTQAPIHDMSGHDHHQMDHSNHMDHSEHMNHSTAHQMMNHMMSMSVSYFLKWIFINLIKLLLCILVPWRLRGDNSLWKMEYKYLLGSRLVNACDFHFGNIVWGSQILSWTSVLEIIQCSSI